MLSEGLRYRTIDDFDDPDIGPIVWNSLLATGHTDEVFLTWQHQRAWWEVFGSDQLRIITVEKDGSLVCIAPLYSDCGMIYLVGSGADYLDVIGTIPNEDVLEQILLRASAGVKGFLGFQFFHILDKSPTALMIQSIATRQGWKFYEEARWICPMLEIEDVPEQADQAVRKKSLIRHEGYFRKNGALRIEHLTHRVQILERIEELFDQHIERWAPTNHPSLFLDEKQRLFYSELIHRLGGTGWLSFTRILWNESPIALHFGFDYKGSFLWYKPSFEIALAKRSPGEVLLRQLLLNAIEKNTRRFDFGLGDEAFKSRFANSSRTVVTLGIYP